MTPQEKKLIVSLNNALSNGIGISLTLTQDDRSEKLSRFCENLSDLAPKISIMRSKADNNDAPSIQVGKRLRFHAVPLGTELEPFLEALITLDKNSVQIAEQIQDRLNKIKMPAELKVFVAQQCPFCPVTIRLLFPLSVASEYIQITIIDCTLFPEIAELNGIRSVPTILLDEDFRWTGSTRLEEVVEVISNRDPVQLRSSSIERIIKEGNAAQVATMMLDKEMIFPAFIELLAHEKWPVRLGAMVVLEYISEKNRELAAQVITPLWELYHDVEDPVKGDIIHIFGETGNHEIVPKLKTILSSPYNNEVKNAAKEAIDKIEQSFLP
jgi:glutaredoxin